jgi:hypothetical protein
VVQSDRELSDPLLEKNKINGYFAVRDVGYDFDCKSLEKKMVSDAHLTCQGKEGFANRLGHPFGRKNIALAAIITAVFLL